MLKVLPPVDLISNSVKAKCGEIFCHSSTNFLIYCTFCDMKSFTFEDFLLHVKNVHFENNLLKTDCINNDFNSYIRVSVKNDGVAGMEEDTSWNILENSFNDSDSCEEESLTVIKKTEKSTKLSKRKKPPKRESDNESSGGDSDFKSQEDFKLMKNVNTISSGTDGKNFQYDKSIENQEFEKISLLDEGDDENTLVKKKKKEIIEHSCPECEEIFPHLKYLDRHVFEFHDGYKCSLCDKRFRLRHHLRGHAKTHATEKKFTCPVEECNKSFTDQEYLKRHLEVHTLDCTFKCDFENCGKSFQTQRRLTIHTYTHRKPKKLVCDACGYSCRANITLRIHQRVHTGEKPFPCEVCEKRFVSKTALTEHMISHSNTRPHICQICNASFANPRVLQRHIFIHSDARTFKCKLCDSAFKQARGLDGHMRRLHRAPKSSTVTVQLDSLF